MTSFSLPASPAIQHAWRAACKAWTSIFRRQASNLFGGGEACGEEVCAQHARTASVLIAKVLFLSRSLGQARREPVATEEAEHTCCCPILKQMSSATSADSYATAIPRASP